MNERIKDLLPNPYAVDYQHSEQPLDLYTEKELEKFAELIIKECIDKIETYRVPVGNSSAGELACEGTMEALRDIRDDIKETFGIEKC